MNIIFYVEPLIEMGKPYFKEGWATSWCRKMIRCLGNRHRYYLILNNAIAERFGHEDNVKVITFTQEELLKVFPKGYVQASASWYLHNYSEEQMEYYISLMHEKLKEDCIDLVITFTQVPFFEKLYPSVRVLHMEYSIFSRIPFPVTWYLDPCGLYENNYLNKYQRQIKDIKLDEIQRGLIKDLKNTCKSIFEENNIFYDDIKKLREQYQYLVLLPIQFSGYYGFDCLSVHKNQFDYLTRSLERVPENIGVIFTMHPNFPIFDEETVRYITSRYKNAIFLENSRHVYAASQWLMPMIDGVITVSSSIGVQTLLFEKKLFAIGNKNMDYIADASKLGNEMEVVLKGRTKDKDSILWFFVTRYAISDKYLFDGDWLNNFINRCISEKVDENFYKEIDEPENIVSKYIKIIRENRSKIPQWVSLAESKEYRCVPRIYYLHDGTYSEESCLQVETITKEDGYCARFKIISDMENNRFRLDPLEGMSACLELKKINTDIINLKIIDSNALLKDGNVFYFLTADPNIEFCGDLRSGSYVEFYYTLNELREEDLKRVIEKKNIKIEMMKKELHSIKQTFVYKFIKKIKEING